MARFDASSVFLPGVARELLRPIPIAGGLAFQEASGTAQSSPQVSSPLAQAMFSQEEEWEMQGRSELVQEANAMEEEISQFGDRFFEEQETSKLFHWEPYSDRHPLVKPYETEFIQECLDVLSDRVLREGGSVSYCRSLLDEAQKRGATAPGAPDVMVMILKSFEAILQERSRVGRNSVFADFGPLMSMGNKKLVNYRIRVLDSDLDDDRVISVVWDWDVKLESARFAASNF